MNQRMSVKGIYLKKSSNWGNKQNSTYILPLDYTFVPFGFRKLFCVK